MLELKVVDHTNPVNSFTKRHKDVFYLMLELSKIYGSEIVIDAAAALITGEEYHYYFGANGHVVFSILPVDR